MASLCPHQKPDDVVTTVNTRLPPPPVQPRPKKPSVPLPSASSRSNAPLLPGPPPSTRSSASSVAPPRPRTRQTSQERPAPSLAPSAAATIQIATPTSHVSPPTASATSLPLPQIPVDVQSSGNGDVSGPMFSVGRAGNAEEEDLGFDPSAEGNIYDVST